MSSISEDAEELPLINSDTSKGSSVSTDMQVKKSLRAVLGEDQKQDLCPILI